MVAYFYCLPSLELCETGNLDLFCYLPVLFGIIFAELEVLVSSCMAVQCLYPPIFSFLCF